MWLDVLTVISYAIIKSVCLRKLSAMAEMIAGIIVMKKVVVFVRND